MDLTKAHIIKKQQIDLCDGVYSSYNSNNAGGCPTSSGWYTMKKGIILPSLHDKDWFLSGYSYNGEIKIYDDIYQSNKLGRCTFKFEATNVYNDAYIHPPSAKSFMKWFGITVAVAGTLTYAGWLWLNREEAPLTPNSSFQLHTDDKKAELVTCDKSGVV